MWRIDFHALSHDHIKKITPCTCAHILDVIIIYKNLCSVIKNTAVGRYILHGNYGSQL